MNITNRVAQTIDEIFSPFEYQIDRDAIHAATCIAYQNLGGYDTRGIYVMGGQSGHPRFFAFSMLEEEVDGAAEAETIKKWADAEDVEFIEKAFAPFLVLYLCEVKKPFGIWFE